MTDKKNFKRPSSRTTERSSKDWKREGKNSSKILIISLNKLKKRLALKSWKSSFLLLKKSVKGHGLEIGPEHWINLQRLRNKKFKEDLKLPNQEKISLNGC